MSEYENNSAIVVEYKSKYYKVLDKTTKGQLQAAWDLNNSSKDDDMIEVSYPSGMSVHAVLIVKTTASTDTEYRNLGGKCFSKYNKKRNHVYFEFNDKTSVFIIEGARLAAYAFSKYRTNTESTMFTYIHGTDSVKTIEESVFLARDLVTEPGNELYPEEYADRINQMLTPLGVTVKIMHEKFLRKLGFDLLLSVGDGSDRDSYVVVMEYMNADTDAAPLALVGKGVTFDSGGISLKPGKGMGDMKTDMGGSAAVVGAMHAIASQNVKANVVGIVGLVENMPSGGATRPGDVIGSLNGQTVENLNTDAEGRLVLADILTYVQTEYKPAEIIDLATLTGAILVTLGHEAAGLFSNSTEFASHIASVGSDAGENYFRMPMGKVWNKMIDSPIADMQNIGGPYGGSTTAAEFLYRFVDSDTPWAHLDIAGMAWADSPKDTTPKGAVGFGVRTLYDIACNLNHDPKSLHSEVYWAIDTDMQY